MKKHLLLVFTSLFLVSCSSRVADPYTSELLASKPSSNQAYPAPSGTPAPYTPTELSSLQAGVLPQESFTQQERKLAGYLIRKTTPVFPLKIGIILYKGNGALPDSDRKKYVDNFLTSIKSNPNIGQVVEISQNLISKYGASIDEIRNVGARFQVSSVFVINENYPYPTENKEAIVTPIDSITGTRTWSTFSKIDVFSVDILNGVFLFSASSSVKENQKYNKNSSTVKNPDLALVRSTADKAWKSLNEKVNKEINDYKVRVETDKVIPIIAETPIPLPQ